MKINTIIVSYRDVLLTSDSYSQSSSSNLEDHISYYINNIQSSKRVILLKHIVKQLDGLENRECLFKDLKNQHGVNFMQRHVVLVRDPLEMVVIDTVRTYDT